MKEIACGCGCGRTFQERNKWGRKRFFISGHNARNPNRKTGETIVCPVCKNTKYVKKYYSEETRRITCSRKCMGIYMSKWHKGPAHNRYKPRIYTHAKGYVSIHCPNHPSASKFGYVMEHRIIAEQKIGRYLKPKEIVHHINGNRLDNRPENLNVMTQSDHIKIHLHTITS